MASEGSFEKQWVKGRVRRREIAAVMVGPAFLFMNFWAAMSLGLIYYVGLLLITGRSDGVPAKSS